MFGFGIKKLPSRAAVAPLRPRTVPLINAELLMALEKLGLFAYANDHPALSAPAAARELKLRPDLLLAACDFLAEENIFEKTGPDTFRLAVDYHLVLEAQNNYFLAYKAVYESFAELLDGSRTYGKDVVRDATRLGFGTRRSIPFLVQRFKELGIRTALDIGCGRGNFLFALAEAIPGFRGIGIEIDRATVAFAEERIKTSPRRESIKVFEGDAAHPELFPKEAEAAEAFYGVAIFHELKKSGKLVPAFREYKKKLPRAKFFLIEFDTPPWDELLREPDTQLRHEAAQYLLTHYFTEQGLPQAKADWVKTLKEAGWDVRAVHDDLPMRLTVFECE